MAKIISASGFSAIRKELQRLEKSREENIQKSRMIIKLSKQIIYAVHRNDMKKAESLMKDIKKKISALPKKEAYDPGMINVAEQEYVEAAAFFSYVKSGKVPPHTALKVNTINYLGGICDLTGEMGRMAVNAAAKGDSKTPLKIRDAVDEIYGEFLQMELRNSELRKKSDQIKWNLKKLEEVAYDIGKRKP